MAFGVVSISFWAHFNVPLLFRESFRTCSFLFSRVLLLPLRYAIELSNTNFVFQEESIAIFGRVRGIYPQLLIPLFLHTAGKLSSSLRHGI